MKTIRIENKDYQVKDQSDWTDDFNKRNNKKEALRAFEELNGARVIEKSMRTGQEKVIKERETA